MQPGVWPRWPRRSVAAVVAGGLASATLGSVVAVADAGQPAAEPVTLTVSYTSDPITTALIEAFETAHPNIDIDATSNPFGDYVNTIRLTLASDSAPDIAQYNAGAMRTLIPAGFLLPLDEYEQSMDWDSTFAPASLDVLRTDASAKRFATGSLYAVPAGLSITGVYYNRQLAADLGIGLPLASLGDFEATLAVAQEAEIAPLTVGALDFNGLHHWAALVNAVGPADEYRDWAYGAAGASIDIDAARGASELIIAWADAGYIPAAANGTSSVDAAAEFAAGQSLFHLDGNWIATRLGEAMGDNVGFFVLPMADGGAADTANGASVAFSISAQTEHPDEAAMFLDFMASPEASAAQVENGYMPANPAAQVGADGVTAEILDAFAVVAANDGIMPFPDHPAPTLLAVLIAGVQGLISGEMSTDEYLASVQAAWEEFHAT